MSSFHLSEAWPSITRPATSGLRALPLQRMDATPQIAHKSRQRGFVGLRQADLMAWQALIATRRGPVLVLGLSKELVPLRKIQYVTRPACRANQAARLPV